VQLYRKFQCGQEPPPPFACMAIAAPESSA
jgi:hypothetical protein